jgi:protein O-mannosyl-transferase
MPDESLDHPSDDRKGKRRARRRPSEERIAADVRERRGLRRERELRDSDRSRYFRTKVACPKSSVANPPPGAPGGGPTAIPETALNRVAAAYRMSNKDWIAAAVLVVATLALYWPAVLCEFVKWDDDVYASENDHVTSGLLPGNLAWAWTAIDGSNWHPLTWLSLQFDATLFGPGPFGFHLDNIIQHALSAAVLFWFLRRLTGAPVPSFAVAALFAWHPLHVESVAWVSERKDTLSTLFWFLTLGAYVSYARVPSFWRYLLLAVLFSLGLLSKPMLVTVPVVLLLLDYWPLARLKISPGPAGESRETIRNPVDGLTIARAVGEKLPLFAIALATSLGAILSQRATGALKSLTNFSLSERIALSATAYVDYLRQMAWPVDLACLYPIVRHSLLEPAGWLSIGFLVVVTLFAVYARRSRPYVLVGWLWYLVTLLPVIGLVAVGDQARADRYTYVPLTGIFIILAWATFEFVRRFPASRSIVVGLSLCVLLLSGQLTRDQIQYWQTNSKLWQHCATLYPSAKSLENVILALGVAHLDRGELDRAAEFFQKLVAANPNDAIATYHLGLVSDRRGNLKEAERYYSSTLWLMPSYWKAHINLGLDLLRDGDLASARTHLEAADREHPGRVAVERGLGDICAAEGRAADATRHWQAALRIQPKDPETLERLDRRTR